MSVTSYDAYLRFNLQHRVTPLLLVVFVFPEDQTKWLRVDDDSTIFERSAWWINASSIPWTEGNTRSCMIKIPRAQRFDPSALRGPSFARRAWS